MAFRCAVPDADGCECAAAPARPARGVQRAGLACAGRCAVAAAAARPAALADGVPAVPALGRGGLLRGDGQRHALDHPGQRRPPGPAQRSRSGRTHAAEQLRKWCTRGLRRLQEAARQQGAHGCRHAGAVDRADGHVRRRAGASAGQGAVRGSAGGHRRDGQAGVGGPGLHRRAGQAGRPSQRDRLADRQTARGAEGVCPAAPTLGGRAQFWLAVTLSPAQP